MRPPDDSPEHSPGLTWVTGADASSDRDMAGRGLARIRTLHQMRRALPVDAELRGSAAPLEVRAFRPGVDDAAVLEVNNRAFDWHPDQGGWDRDRLRTGLAQDWVRLDGFLVHDGADGKVDGFCWTRIHPASAAGDAPMGEVFVIAADPRRHGTGLGRALVLAGLDHLTREGLGIAMLYVESDNAPALRLYERLGFTVHHSDAAYAP